MSKNFDLIKAVKAGDVVLLQNILSKNPDLNIQESEDNKTALHIAVEFKDEAKAFEMSSLILNSGLPINLEIRDDFNNTPLLSILEFKRPVLLSLLISKGAKFKDILKDKVSLLFYVCKAKSEDMAIALVKHGVAIKGLQIDGKDILVWSIENKFFKLAESLLDARIKVDLNKNLSGLKKVINVSSKFGPPPCHKTILHLAIESSSASIVKKLLSLDQKIDFTLKGKYNKTVLELASRNDRLEMLHVLLSCADKEILEKFDLFDKNLSLLSDYSSNVYHQELHLARILSLYDTAKLEEYIEMLDDINFRTLYQISKEKNISLVSVCSIYEKLKDLDNTVQFIDRHLEDIQKIGALKDFLYEDIATFVKIRKSLSKTSNIFDMLPDYCLSGVIKFTDDTRSLVESKRAGNLGI